MNKKEKIKYQRFDIVPYKRIEMKGVIIDGQRVPVFVVNPLLKSLIWKHYNETGEILKPIGTKIVYR